jgi:hypothetical protein
MEHMMEKEMNDKIAKEEELKKVSWDLNSSTQPEETEWGQEIDDVMREEVSELDKLDNMEEEDEEGMEESEEEDEDDEEDGEVLDDLVGSEEEEKEDEGKEKVGSVVMTGSEVNIADNNPGLAEVEEQDVPLQRQHVLLLYSTCCLTCT